MGKYLILDNDNTLVGEEPFSSEREAYEAKKIYEANCSDVARPLRVVPDLFHCPCGAAVAAKGLREHEKHGHGAALTAIN